MTHNLFYEYGHALYISNVVCICSMITNGKHAKNYMMNEWDFNEKCTENSNNYEKQSLNLK